MYIYLWIYTYIQTHILYLILVARIFVLILSCSLDWPYSTCSTYREHRSPHEFWFIAAIRGYKCRAILHQQEYQPTRTPAKTDQCITRKSLFIYTHIDEACTIDFIVALILRVYSCSKYCKIWYLIHYWCI